MTKTPKLRYQFFRFVTLKEVERNATFDLQSHAFSDFQLLMKFRNDRITIPFRQ